MDTYDEESYRIPDSDAKIYMSLDDIIRMEGIRKPGPGSVRSVASRRSAYSHKSNRSHRSTYSVKSNHSYKSQRSNYSNRSYRSRRSTYSNKSNNRFGFQQGFRRGYDGMQLENQYKYLKSPGLYIPRSRSVRPFVYYRHAVRNAVRTLTNRVSKRTVRRGGINQPFNGWRQNVPQHFITDRHSRLMLPTNIAVEVRNNKQIAPQLTVQTLKEFNRMHNSPMNRRDTTTYNSSRMSKSYGGSTYTYLGSRVRRHSVRGSLAPGVQREIAVFQETAKTTKDDSEDLFTNMEYSPTPHFTEFLVNDRFSSYD